MTDERYRDLMNFDSMARLTHEEQDQGWHFCYEFDGLLVGPQMDELLCCRCLDAMHPVYMTVLPEQVQDCTFPADDLSFLESEGTETSNLAG